MGGSNQGTSLFAYIMAIAGWVLAAATFAWKIIGDRRDTRKLLVTGRFHIEFLIQVGDYPPIESYCLYATIANTGKRPATVQGCYAKYRDGEVSENFMRGAKSLEPHGSPVECTLINGVPDDEFLEKVRRIDKIYVPDTAQKKWKMRKKELRRLKAEGEVTLPKWKDRYDGKG